MRGIRRDRLDRSRRLSPLARRAVALPTTIPPAGWSTPVALVLASTMRSWNVCGAASNRWPRPTCHWRSPAPRKSRFGSPLVLRRVHWVRPELVAELKYLTWTEDNLLRQVVYEGLREDKPAAQVHRPVPHPAPTTKAPAR